MDNYKYYAHLDSFDNDIDYVNGNLTQIAEKCNSLPSAVAFNTVGYIKNLICPNIGDLKMPQCFINQDRGIYIKNEVLNLNHNNKIRIKMMCNWCSSQTLCNEWKHMMSDPDKLCHYNLEFTWNDNNIDLYVIINKPQYNDIFIPERTIVFHMEPWCYDPTQNWGVKTWGEWARPNYNKFLHVRTHDRYFNNAFWQLSTTYNEFKRMPIIKTKVLSSICSSKYFDPGHIKRIDFIRYIESKKEIDLSVFNHDNNFKLNNCYNGPHPPNFKDAGIMPYKYYFMAENNDEYNFITEKIWEPILCECVCFYWGCSNVLDYINKDAIIILDLNNIEESYNIVKKAILNNEWEKRIEVIRQEKQKILDYYQFFATMERIVIHDLHLYKGISTNMINYNKYYSKINKNPKKLDTILFYDYSPSEENNIIDSLQKFNNDSILYHVDYIFLIAQDEYSSIDNPIGKQENKVDEFKNYLTNLFPLNYFKFFIIKYDKLDTKYMTNLVNIYKNIYPSDNTFIYNSNDERYKSWLHSIQDTNKDRKYETIIVNLKHRVDRREYMESLLKENNIKDYKFYEAIYGKELTLNDFDINMFNGNDFGYRKAFIGCALSHYNIWQSLVSSDNDFYIIFEDDITVVSDFKTKLQDIIKKIDDNVDFIYLGYTMRDSDLRIDYNKYKNNFNKVELTPLRNSYYIGGFFGYIITKKAAMTMLSYIKDKGIMHGIDYLPKLINLNMKECNPFIVNSSWVQDHTSLVDSDIQKDYDAFKIDTLDSMIHSDDYVKVIEKTLPFIVGNNSIKNICFIHSCYTDTLEVLNNLVGLITTSGLLDKLDYIFVINIGNNIYYEHTKIKIINYSKNITLFEKPTINLLCNFSKYIESIGGSCNILYLHTKGTHSKGQQIEDWKDLMLYFLVEKWDYCIKYLEKFTSIGVNYLEKPFPHYSGNFWWTKSSYVKNKNIIKSDKRHDCEWYILNKDCGGQNNLSLHNSNVNHYNELYPRSLYDTEKIKLEMNDMLNTISNT